MYSGRRSTLVIGLILLAYLGPVAQSSQAQQLRIESFFPRQIAPGQTIVISLAVPSREPAQSAEVSPAAGVKVAAIKRGENIQGNLSWSELTLEVAKDAAPGTRTLVLQFPMGRTAPVTLMIPNHVPRISELRPVSGQSKQATLELQFDAVDGSADLGELPYVWYAMKCGDESYPGVVHGKLTARDKTSGSIRTSIPNPRASAGTGGPAINKCDLQVRVTDSGGIESNTLRSTVDFKN